MLNQNNFIKFNRAAWDKQVDNKNKWTIPVNHETIEEARKGKWEVVLTPIKTVPRNWFPEMKNKNILCLASAGGQQAPVFASAGANVTLFDLSKKQLNQDKFVADRESLNIDITCGNMDTNFPFKDKSFDLIFNPISNCFISDVKNLWQECYRVLKRNGILITGFCNPLLYLFNPYDPDKETSLNISCKIPYSDFKYLDTELIDKYIEQGIPFEFGHTLEDQIGGQINAGFAINGFYEDRFPKSEHPISDYIDVFIATRAVKL